ncbi:MAG: PRD domain-containing protein [Anaerococcus sp.]|nr:PRD domain-containing protein [Anaerococcus sp.]
MIETRTKEIFDYLTSDYIFHTSEEIGKALELSSKTIQKEIRILNSYINGKGAYVESEIGKGYIFKIYDEEKFKDFLKYDWYKYAYFHQENPNKDFRIENILKLLLFSNSYIKQQDLADMFYVSLSQINKDIKKVRKLLKDYKIKLISKPYYGMKIEASEKSIRLAIRNELGEDPEIFGSDGDKKLFFRIQEIISDINFPDFFYMPYVNFKNLVIHIYISILRIKDGKYIKITEDMQKKVISYDEFNVAKLVVDQLGENLDIEFPKDEILYLTMHLVSKNAVTNYEKVSQEVSSLAQGMIDEVYNLTKYDFRSNIDLFFALALHLGPLIERIKMDLPMKNPILEDIKDNQVAFMIATVSSKLIRDTYHKNLTDDEIGYLALHFASAMEAPITPKRNLLVVCGSGNSSAQIMKTQLERRYKDQIENLTLIDVSKIFDLDLDDFDFIVSSVDIKFETKTPIVYVDIIFKQKDFENIDNLINENSLREIDDIFENSIFLKNVEIKNKEECLYKLADLASKKIKEDPDTLLSQFLERENMAFTAYNKVALPHILKQIEGKSFSIILIPKKPINWDRHKVELIYSLFVGSEVGEINSYYEKLGEFLNNDKQIDKAIMADTLEEFKNIFLKGRDDG